MIIDKLTPEQEAKIPIYLNKWLDNGRSTARLDREKTKKAIKTIYRCAGFEEPKYFFFFPSPLQCQLAISICKKLKNKDLNELLKNESNLGSNLWSNLWSNLGSNLEVEYSPMFCGNIEWIIGWTGFYDYVLNELFEDKINEYGDFIQYLEALKQIHIFIPFKNIVIISERPSEINLNSSGKLHADLKPAMMYEDGYSLFYLNGIKMPKHIIETKSEDLETLKVIAEQNVDVRREGLRKISLERIIKETGAKELDTWHDPAKNWCDYVLYDMDFKDGKIRRVLKMKNPSVPDTVHFERVEDNITTVKQALAWRNGQENYLTPEPYFYERWQLT